MAQVFEAAFQYEFKVETRLFRGLYHGFRRRPVGEFEIVIELGNVTGNTGTVVIYETA